MLQKNNEKKIKHFFFKFFVCFQKCDKKKQATETYASTLFQQLMERGRQKIHQKCFQILNSILKWWRQEEFKFSLKFEIKFFDFFDKQRPEQFL